MFSYVFPQSLHQGKPVVSQSHPKCTARSLGMSTTKVQEYPTCIKSYMEDDNCVSCNYNLVSQQCEFSNVTKALFADEFVNKYYSIYTEML